MSSNEHPDMSGSGCDEPYVCTTCGKEFPEWKAIGVSNNDEVIFCSNECAESWVENQLESQFGG